MTAPILRMRKRFIQPENDTRRLLIDLFKLKFKSEIGEDDPTPWGKAMMGMLHFRYVDEMTGEEIVDFPTEKAWRDQLDGYFNDEWARDKMGYSFDYFLKHFGKFAKYKKVPKAKVEVVSPWDTCPDCGKDFLKTEGHKCA